MVVQQTLCVESKTVQTGVCTCCVIGVLGMSFLKKTALIMRLRPDLIFGFCMLFLYISCFVNIYIYIYIYICMYVCIDVSLFQFVLLCFDFFFFDKNEGG